MECSPIMRIWLLDWIDICLKLFTTANYIDCQIHVSKSELACKMFMRSKPGESEGLSFSLYNHIGHTNCIQNETQKGVYILNTYSNIIITRFSLVPYLNWKPCHTPLKYKCLIKKIDHIRPTYPMWPYSWHFQVPSPHIILGIKPN
jgi:hypothetical protein